MTPGKIIAIAITCSFAINGIAVSFTINAMDKQERALVKLSEKVDKKMDDRYRRVEAEEAHKYIMTRIIKVENRDDKIEAELDEHIKDGR